jgi:hypothetical protein
VFMDVVPAISPSGMEKVLWVPDRDRKRWIKSNPIGYVNYASTRNGKSNGRYVKIVKTCKAWAQVHLQENLKPKSFLLEAMVDQVLDTAAKGLPRTFLGTVRALLAWLAPYAKQGLLPRVQDPSLDSNDLAESCRWTPDSLKALVFELRKSENTLLRAIEEKDKKQSIVLWREVLGTSYPESLEDEEAKLGEDDGRAVVRRLFPYDVAIRARLARTQGGETFEEYPSGGRKLEKELWIRFDIVRCNVPGSYTIKWQVTNHGREARKNPADLRHSKHPGEPTQWEVTRYKGHHFLDCEILKDGKRVALARHQVNIA